MADSNSKDEALISLSGILNIDRELARYYLERTRWSLEVAINEYYADTADTTEKKATLTDKPPPYDQNKEETSNSIHSLSTSTGTPDGSNLKLLCWNLDGLDRKDLEERTAAVVENILLKKPDVVMLQEVVAYSLKVFQENCEGYIVLPGNYTFPYFNAILVRTSTVLTKASSLQSVGFETSKMGRYYLIQPIKFAEAKIIVMTSHFESLSEHGAERKKQFSEILDYMKRQSENFNVIFGGDTNLRDAELNAVGGLSGGVLDAWESCGSALTSKYTWNMAENDNMDKKYQKPPKLRFDRIFVRPAKGPKAIKPISFTLVGKERLKGCKRFASDHWGVWLEFGIH
ncbi:tyrosyl-DNA phosphodiesterase 2-like isoform X2 [Dendronephthya gigantea]|uniref:tyrosyl-DNA phosphodiesterase 2-like isoform X2 n=1 Tax=Dendronephthya gigantea TaxID=151771 RepID=UPI00106BF364|nr:tyrosyl-DNA phosphodiesterase 2-like isoform X2 [Dendronephthya gigantea]